MDPRLERIVAGLVLIRQFRPNVKSNAPLCEAEVRQFEVHHRIELPEEYRGFLVNVGNGGTGPNEICKLGEFREILDEKDWWNGLVGNISEPFPHTEAWNDLSGTPKGTRNAPIEEEEELERKWEEWRRSYCRTSNMNGAMPISDTGCGHRLWLIVNGPERNHLWNDSRGSEGGLYPVRLQGKGRVTFLEWYCDWLDRKLDELKAKR